MHPGQHIHQRVQAYIAWVVKRRFASRVIVLPLHGLHGSDAQERLAQSATGHIVTDLDRYLKELAFRDAKVLFPNDWPAQSRTSSRDSRPDYVLRGGVQGTHRPSVNLQLQNAESGVCLWAKRRELDRRHAVIAGLMFDAPTVLVSGMSPGAS